MFVSNQVKQDVRRTVFGLLIPKVSEYFQVNVLRLSTVFLHRREDKFWISLGVNPKNVPTLPLDLNHESKIINVDVKLAEKMTYFLPKPNGHCEVYDEGPIGYNICYRKFIAAFLKETTECTLPGKSYLPFHLFENFVLVFDSVHEP